MSLSFRNTIYTELYGQGYPQESFSSQASEATRVYLVDWSSRQQAAIDFLGIVKCYPVSGTRYDNSQGTVYGIERTTPDYHQDYLQSDGQTPFLWADSVTFEPYGVPVGANGSPIYGNESTLSDEGSPLYNKAKMTVHYGTRLYGIYSDDEMPSFSGRPDESSLKRYVETPYAVAAQYLTLPEGTFKIAQPPTDINGNNTGAPAGPVPGAPGKIEGEWDVTLIWRQVPRRMIAAAAVVAPILPAGTASQNAAFDYAIGRVNKQVFNGYPAGTLLCEPMELTQWVQADGDIVYDVTFHFKYKRAGWNYFLVPNGGNLQYTEISADGNAHAEPAPDKVHQYDSYNFQALFFGYDYSAGLLP